MTNSCKNCIKLDACKFYEAATSIDQEYNGRFGETVKLPMIPEELAEKCKSYISVISAEKHDVQVVRAFLFKELEKAKAIKHEERQIEIQQVLADMYGVTDGGLTP